MDGRILFPAVGAVVGGGKGYLGSIAERNRWEKVLRKRFKYRDRKFDPNSEEGRDKLREGVRSATIKKTLAYAALGGLVGLLAAHSSLYRDRGGGNQYRGGGNQYRGGGNQYRGGGGGNQYSHFTAGETKLHFNALGIDKNKMKTKEQFKKHFRDLANKYHPDKGGSEAKMKEMNNARDELMGTSWFQKLAHFMVGFEKRARERRL